MFRSTAGGIDYDSSVFGCGGQKDGHKLVEENWEMGEVGRAPKFGCGHTESEMGLEISVPRQTSSPGAQGRYTLRTHQPDDSIKTRGLNKFTRREYG